MNGTRYRPPHPQWAIGVGRRGRCGLRHDYDLTPARADQTIRAGIATNEETDLLAIRDDPDPLVLHLNRTTYDSRDWPVEYSSSVYRATFYEFHVSAHGTGARATVPSILE